MIQSVVDEMVHVWEDLEAEDFRLAVSSLVTLAWTAGYCSGSKAGRGDDIAAMTNKVARLVAGACCWGQSTSCMAPRFMRQYKEEAMLAMLTAAQSLAD